jgi:lysine--tRNA ligase
MTEQELIRREKLAKLRELGINPYPAELFPVNFLAKDIETQYEEGKDVVVAGRLMSSRIQEKPLSPPCKTALGAYNSTLSAMTSAQGRTRPSIMRCSKNYWT